MAARSSTRGSFAHLATKEEIDTYNAIHKKLVDLNLGIMFIDQQLVTLVQECSKRRHFEVWLLKRRIAQIKRKQESIKEELREMMVVLFQSKCSDISDLESFILEQEVYSLLSTKRDDELSFLMRTIEGFFMRAVDMNRNKAISLARELDQTSKISNSAGSDIDLSDDEMLLSGPQRLNIGDMEMSLSDVVVKLYAFSHDRALDIQECVATRKMASEAFKNDFPNDFNRMENGFDQLDYLDHQFISADCEQEDNETLNRKSHTRVKQKFQDLLQTGTYYEDVLKAMKIWVFHIESVFCDLVYNLYDVMSGYEPALIKFQKFNSELNKKKETNRQMVPIIAYKIVAIPEAVYQGAVGIEKADLCKKMDLDQVIKGLESVITILGFVLRKTSSFLIEKAMDKRLLTSYEALLDVCERLLKDIGFMINGAKLNQLQRK